ncbi:hypothetical protein COX25_05505 [bacterium (Candidatus Howlettbacteria) CG23_combo_of_CG06-09_8_20_14_all_37_9]|nr:MAG: hypothetical protein COX25_05505 [bacterium (Candidatus Howlettbacteria) CG23_combo_of_CG06-09_8_20_14_all_37_9]
MRTKREPRTKCQIKNFKCQINFQNPFLLDSRLRGNDGRRWAPFCFLANSIFRPPQPKRGRNERFLKKIPTGGRTAVRAIRRSGNFFVNE